MFQTTHGTFTVSRTVKKSFCIHLFVEYLLKMTVASTKVSFAVMSRFLCIFDHVHQIKFSHFLAILLTKLTLELPNSRLSLRI